jgi:hypothetical protein
MAVFTEIPNSRIRCTGSAVTAASCKILSVRRRLGRSPVGSSAQVERVGQAGARVCVDVVRGHRQRRRQAVLRRPSQPAHRRDRSARPHDRLHLQPEERWEREAVGPRSRTRPEQERRGQRLARPIQPRHLRRRRRIRHVLNVPVVRQQRHGPPVQLAVRLDGRGRDRSHWARRHSRNLGRWRGRRPRGRRTPKEPPSEFLPAAPGIQQGASRRSGSAAYSATLFAGLQALVDEGFGRPHRAIALNRVTEMARARRPPEARRSPGPPRPRSTPPPPPDAGVRAPSGCRTWSRARQVRRPAR